MFNKAPSTMYTIRVNVKIHHPKLNKIGMYYLSILEKIFFQDLKLFNHMMLILASVL